MGTSGYFRLPPALYGIATCVARWAKRIGRTSQFFLTGELRYDCLPISLVSECIGGKPHRINNFAINASPSNDWSISGFENDNKGLR